MIYLLFIPVFVCGLALGTMFCGHEGDARDAMRKPPERFVVRQFTPHCFQVIDSADMRVVSTDHWTFGSAFTLARSLNTTKENTL